MLFLRQNIYWWNFVSKFGILKTMAGVFLAYIKTLAGLLGECYSCVWLERNFFLNRKLCVKHISIH